MLQIGDPAPDFLLSDLNGRPHRLSDYRGRIVILNFWSADCPWVERVDRELLACLQGWGEGVLLLPIAANPTESDELIAAGRKIDFVLAVGPVPMMRAVAQLTAPLGIKTMVSLNSIMVDGTGMCGGCRVLLGNKSKFACVDGPEFDASLVNFDVLMQRNSMYREKECQSLKHFQEHTLEELVELRAELAEKERELAELRSIPITLNPKRRPMKNEVQNV